MTRRDFWTWIAIDMAIGFFFFWLTIRYQNSQPNPTK